MRKLHFVIFAGLLSLALATAFVDQAQALTLSDMASQSAQVTPTTAPVAAPVEAASSEAIAPVSTDGSLPSAGAAQNVVYAFVAASTIGYYLYSWYLKRRAV